MRVDSPFGVSLLESIKIACLALSQLMYLRDLMVRSDVEMDEIAVVVLRV